ncbi:hypothetical protein DAPPUDRAFT_117517 [Daphnia pulex]|uniref:Uncharacterized protein n=1 Tax=Daphnia pulex TaxID=6669 RepID=E9HSY2_DAPPU|nr:hypothetical protein DAPPUDRAFT_117517 [Daphnia pulex]|eukprot:EFX65152.1 hypothetical protein DAPPUDRAFT_117517 [Daphnia pulex]
MERSRRCNASVPAKRFTPEQSTKSRRPGKSIPEEPVYTKDIMNDSENSRDSDDSKSIDSGAKQSPLNDQSLTSRSSSSSSIDTLGRGFGRGRGRPLSQETPKTGRIASPTRPINPSGCASLHLRRIDTAVVGKKIQRSSMPLDVEEAGMDEGAVGGLQVTPTTNNTSKVASKRPRVDEEVREGHQSRTNSAASELQLLNQEKYCRMIAATYTNSQEMLRRQGNMALKINILTDYVAKLRVDADESSQKNQRMTAVDDLIEKFPLNELSDFDNFERRLKRKVLNKELAHEDLVC